MPLGPQMKSKKNGTKEIFVNGFIFECDDILLFVL
jgi:hypothetical protein